MPMHPNEIPGLEAEIIRLRAENKAKDAEIALLEKQIIGRDQSVQIAWNQKAELEAQLEARVKELEEAALAGTADLSVYDGLNTRIAELEARLAEARKLLSDGGVYFYWRRIKARAEFDLDARRIYQQVPVNLSALLDEFVDAIDDAREEE